MTTETETVRQLTLINKVLLEVEGRLATIAQTRADRLDFIAGAFISHRIAKYGACTESHMSEAYRHAIAAVEARDSTLSSWNAEKADKNEQ